MNEKDILLSHIFDLKDKCADNSMMTFSNFMSVEEISIINQTQKSHSKYVNTFYFGGYSDAERCITVFLPKFLEVEDIQDYFLNNEQDNPLCLIDIVKDKFCELSHRDYLGSLMGLGIKREMIGDITVKENGCYVFCLKSISNFICENLKRIGRGAVQCSIVNINDYKLKEQKIKRQVLSVTSLRADNFIASAFNFSRAKSVEFIKKGIVFINSAQCLKNDFLLKPGDKVVLRGKGKVVFSEVLGESKKGKLRIEVLIYI